jgi:imidazolonepropionase-like amidohydrolase
LQATMHKIVMAGQVLLGDDFRAEKEMAIIIANGVIQDIKPASQIPRQSDYEVLDFPELCFMPGLIDSHNHLSLDYQLPNYLERMNDPLPALVIRAVKNLLMDHSAKDTEALRNVRVVLSWGDLVKSVRLILLKDI